MRSARNWAWMFPLDDPPDYAAARTGLSMAALAAARGCTPQEIAYDRLLATGRQGPVPRSARQLRKRQPRQRARNAVSHPDCIPALGDGGAHYGAICDASYSTFLLKHFVRDGRDGGFGLSEAVHMLTPKAARAVGLNDRGVLGSGHEGRHQRDRYGPADTASARYRARPARRRTAAGPKATGYDATIVSGRGDPADGRGDRG